MNRLGIEARVGAFVLAAVAVLVGFVLALGDFSLRPGTKINADFAYTSGLQVGAPVMISGVRVGKVVDLGLLGAVPQPPPAASRPRLGQRRDPLVRAGLEIAPDVVHLFASDALLHVGTKGVIGETYLELTPGTGAPLLANGTLRGVDAPRLHIMALELSALLSAVSSLVGGGGNDGDVGLGAVGEAISSLLNTVNSIVSERRVELSQALADLGAAAGDVRVIVGEVRIALDDGKALGALISDSSAVAAEVRKNLPPLLAKANQSLDAVESLTKKADSAVDGEALQVLLSDVQSTTKRLEQITVDAQALMRSVRRGEGTIGGFIKDPQIYDDTKEMLRDLKRNPWKFLWRD